MSLSVKIVLTSQRTLLPIEMPNCDYPVHKKTFGFCKNRTEHANAICGFNVNFLTLNFVLHQLNFWNLLVT